MADAIRLYLRYVAVSIRAQMEYRASFVMLSISSFVGTGIEFMGIWALFDRFRGIPNWSLAETAMLYGMISISFAAAEAMARGFDTFDQMIRMGDFDRLLLRPRNTILQILGREFQLMRVGRFAQGLIVLAWAVNALDVVWSPTRVGLMLAALAGGWRRRSSRSPSTGPGSGGSSRSWCRRRVPTSFPRWPSLAVKPASCMRSHRSWGWRSCWSRCKSGRSASATIDRQGAEC